MAQTRIQRNGNALLEKAHRYESNGWVFVHIEGQPLFFHESAKANLGLRRT